MKSLKEVMEGITILEVVGNLTGETGEPAIDSRKIQPDGLFVAIEGTQTDGHKFIDNVIQNGARVVVCQRIPSDMRENVIYIRIADTTSASGIIAHNYFGKPTNQLRLIGVTGTNGKTTTVTLLHELMLELGLKSGLISTVECRIIRKVIPSTHTTPDPVSLNALLAEMVSNGCDFAFMEVSSHAIDQKRISGLRFEGGVFTNITHDHLDYHGDFKHYLGTKKKFFDGLGAQAFALINADDPRGEVMVQNTVAKVSKYSLHKLTEFKAKILGNHLEGLHLRLDDVEMMSRLVGDFNAYNILAVYSCAILLGFDRQEVITALSGLPPVEGRFDLIRHPRSGKSVIVDYAHTPDALKKVLSTLQQLKGPGSKLIAVVGCGGDRDRTKRPRMANMAATMADITILTSDNPRTEDPEEIIKEMQEGIAKERSGQVFKITDRKEAIRAAIQFAGDADIILIAGKGHEKYQEINGVKHPFDDKAIVQNALLKDI
jgi:UDP-N-acetylmuramoyl-L-alanyl-D-glutamate--2,6-diaminopimelate ligase